jgi:hypothetical protein
MKQEIALIDLENIGSMKDVKIENFIKTIIFIGAKQSKFSLENIPSDRMYDISFFRTKKISKNNLDFHIAYYLGKLNEIENKNIEFVIISNDKGYDELIKTINLHGRRCIRKSMNYTQEKKDEKIKLLISSLMGKEIKKLPKSEISLKNYIKSHLGEFNSKSNINHIYNRLLKNSTIANRINSMESNLKT